MREIKFRCWDGKYMHFPYAFELGINSYNGEQSISFTPKGWGEGYITTSYVMQYTGLQDKNESIGQDVYEGDIIGLTGTVKGNIHEMDAGQADLIIPSITSRAWADAYKEAVARGLTHAE